MAYPTADAAQERSAGKIGLRRVERCLRLAEQRGECGIEFESVSQKRGDFALPVRFRSPLRGTVAPELSRQRLGKTIVDPGLRFIHRAEVETRKFAQLFPGIRAKLLGPLGVHTAKNALQLVHVRQQLRLTTEHLADEAVNLTLENRRLGAATNERRAASLK